MLPGCTGPGVAKRLAGCGARSPVPVVKTSDVTTSAARSCSAGGPEAALRRPRQGVVAARGRTFARGHTGVTFGGSGRKVAFQGSWARACDAQDDRRSPSRRPAIVGADPGTAVGSAGSTVRIEPVSIPSRGTGIAHGGTMSDIQFGVRLAPRLYPHAGLAPPGVHRNALTASLYHWSNPYTHTHQCISFRHSPVPRHHHVRS